MRILAPWQRASSSPSARYTAFSATTRNSELPRSRFLGSAATGEWCKRGAYIVINTSREAWGYLCGGCFSWTSKESEYKVESYVVHRLNVVDILVHWDFLKGESECQMNISLRITLSIWRSGGHWLSHLICHLFVVPRLGSLMDIEPFIQGVRVLMSFHPMFYDAVLM